MDSGLDHGLDYGLDNRPTIQYLSSGMVLYAHARTYNDDNTVNRSGVQTLNAEINVAEWVQQPHQVVWLGRVEPSLDHQHECKVRAW